MTPTTFKTIQEWIEENRTELEEAYIFDAHNLVDNIEDNMERGLVPFTSWAGRAFYQTAEDEKYDLEHNKS